jgi:hypothetical protein
MPDLKLSTDTLDTRDALAEVEAAMLFPDDAEMRDTVRRVERQHALIEAAKAGDFQIDAPTMAEAMEAALHTPTPAWLQEQTKRPAYYGGVAGVVLLRLLYGEHTDQRAEYTIRKTAPKVTGALWRSYVGNLAEETIKQDVWPRFAPVAHLWSAYITLTNEGIKEFPCRIRDLPRFLALAEQDRHAGESQRLYRRSETALKPGETWRVPETVKLPAVTASWPHVDC